MSTALVIDSDRQSADHLCRILALLDVPTIPAYSWRAGLLALEEEEGVEQDSIEILFLGLSDTCGEGFDLSRFTRPVFLGRQIPVVLVAPASCSDISERVKQVGAREVIIKPAMLGSVASVLVGMNLI